jgi:hypothetical protein
MFNEIHASISKALVQIVCIVKNCVTLAYRWCGPSALRCPMLFTSIDHGRGRRLSIRHETPPGLTSASPARQALE